jgi:hypothetical protein
VEDLDREVVTLLPHQLAALFLEHDPGSVVGIDDLVALLEVTDIGDLLVEACLHGLIYL